MKLLVVVLLLAFPVHQTSPSEANADRTLEWLKDVATSADFYEFNGSDAVRIVNVSRDWRSSGTAFRFVERDENRKVFTHRLEQLVPKGFDHPATFVLVRFWEVSCAGKERV